MTRRPSLRVALLALLAVGCSVGSADGDVPSREVTGVTAQRMVNGTVSTTAQDATVMIVKDGQPWCSGTLIAPNLVLSARHCVAAAAGAEDCTGYGPQASAASFSVVLGVDARPTGPIAARGARLFVPPTSNMCTFDVALIQLDRDVAGGRIAKVRFRPVTEDEPAVTVGYGVDGRDRTLPQRMQRATTVLGVGPMSLRYETKAAVTLTYALPQGDVATGESTCYGDSGGPLFDAQGAVVAVTSRGIPDFPENGAHGNGCIDLPSIYASVLSNEATIRGAAQAAGHPLPLTDAPAEDDTDPGADEDDDEDEIDPRSADDEDEDDDTPTRKKSRRMFVQSAGCATAPGSGGGGAVLAAAAMALGLVAARRRRSPARRARR